jgi:23S rRNA U2552 (ribose-2'-O)-methylase RlmE/FtsJ
MKKMICLDCDKEFQSQSKEDILNQMMPHYMEFHKEMIEGQNKESKNEWFSRFNKNWEEAEEV